MFYGRLIDVLLEWFETGRFPREELRIRPAIAVAFIVVILVLTVALALHACSGSP